MRNKIACLIVLTLALLSSDFHAPYVAAFFDYNTFHPMPYRPDLQEKCPQVSDIPLATHSNRMRCISHMRMAN